MTINRQTFEQLLKLNAPDFIELLETVAVAAMARDDQREARLTFAALLANHGISIFESEECDISMTINSNEWEEAIDYAT